MKWLKYALKLEHRMHIKLKEGDTICQGLDLPPLPYCGELLKVLIQIDSLPLQKNVEAAAPEQDNVRE